MTAKTLIGTLNYIKSLIETGKHHDIKGYANIFGRLDGPKPDKFFIIINGRKNVIEFERLTHQLWKKQTNIFETVTLKSFQSAIVHIIRRSIEEDREINQSDFNDLKNALTSKKITKYEIFKEIKGCTIKAENPFSINQFNFFSWPEHADFIKKVYKKAFDLNSQYFYNDEDNKQLISIYAESRERERGLEIAEQKFKQLENILRYLVTDTNHSNEGVNMYDIGIYDHREQNWQDSIIINQDSISGISKLAGTYNKIELTENSLKKTAEAKRLWEILNKKQKSKIETRILNAVEWIGKAKHELSSEKAIVEYLFAIEALINFSELGIVSPSINASMRESIALLLGNSMKERIELDETFTRLYSIRSSIVHGSTKNFSRFDLEDAKKLSEKIVSEFLTNKNLTNSSVDNIKFLVKKKKYASS